MEIKYNITGDIEMIVLNVDDVINFKYIKSSTIDLIRKILYENCMESVTVKIPGITYEIFSNGKIKRLNENESAFMRFSQKSVDRELNLVESPNDKSSLREIKRILRKSKYRYLKYFRQLFDNDSDMNNMRRAIEKSPNGELSLIQVRYIIKKLGLKSEMTNDFGILIYLPGGEIVKIQNEFAVKSLYPKINIPQETKSFTGQKLIEELTKINEKLEKQQKAWLECRKELKQNNSFELKKIKVFLPGDLYKKNKGKDFKHLELHFNSDVWNMVKELEYLMHNQRIIQINTTDEPGYSYKPINFSIYDLSDEEFNEILKIFNLQGSCTSKISLCDL